MFDLEHEQEAARKEDGWVCPKCFSRYFWADGGRYLTRSQSCDCPLPDAIRIRRTRRDHANLWKETEAKLRHILRAHLTFMQGTLPFHSESCLSVLTEYVVALRLLRQDETNAFLRESDKVASLRQEGK